LKVTTKSTLEMKAAQFLETLLSYHITTWCYNPEAHDLKFRILHDCPLSS